MKMSDASVRKAALGGGGLILLSLALGSASADTFRYGGSTATIEQGGDGASRSEVIRYQDGQKIVTQDGNSTDITIQGGGGSRAPDDGWGLPEWGDDRFDRQRIEERFSRGADAFPAFTVSAEREALRQQMLNRMRSRFRP
jgi:hypothetical protein